MKLLLTLSLALSLAPRAEAAPAGDGTPLSRDAAAAFDGVARRASGGRSRRSVARRSRRRGVGNRSAAKLGPLPVVTEVDGEGLRKVLQRDPDPAKARPLLVNFWATWCEPCRTEFPDLVKIDEDFRPRGLDFIAVSVDDVSEIKSGVPAFLRRMRASMPAYLLNASDTDVVVNAVDPTWGGELPATFLFDRGGALVFKHTGRIKPAELSEVIEKVLGGK